MLVKINAGSVVGIDARPVTVEVSVGSGHKYYIVGLPDAAIRESFQRIESSLKNSSLKMPRQKILVNLAPADIKKEGSAYDLSIAAGILAATGQWEGFDFSDYLIMGELSLDGSLQAIRGVLPLAIYARKSRFKGFILPQMNAPEAAIVSDLEVIGLKNVSELVSLSADQPRAPSLRQDTRQLFQEAMDRFDFDFQDVKGQASVKRALEVAAAGGHNALMIGPPGSGKTMLAKRIPTILPPLNLREALETTKIHSVTGKYQQKNGLMAIRPFRAPHHTISDIALVGGGIDLKPGEISLAHNGVLFLDELPEFKRSALEVLRQPLESRKILISRARTSVEYPASFMLIASMNPCPCGNYTHPDKECTCPPGMVKKYLSRISGPLMDRIDLHIQVFPVAFDALQGEGKTEKSEKIRARVIEARERQVARFRTGDPMAFQDSFSENEEIHCNAQLNKKYIQQCCSLDSSGAGLLAKAMDKLSLSARAYERILKVSRTIADLESSECIRSYHVAEAIYYRSLDRTTWG